MTEGDDRVVPAVIAGDDRVVPAVIAEKFIVVWSPTGELMLKLFSTCNVYFGNSVYP